MCKSSYRTKTKILVFIDFLKTWILEKGGPIFVKDMTINAETALICSKHFEAEAYEKGLKYELLGEPVPKTLIKIKHGSVPTLHMP